MDAPYPHNQLNRQDGNALNMDSTNTKYIYFHRPCLGKEEETEIIAAMRSGWITTGERTKKFEKKICDFTGSPYAIGLNSCTAGLHLALLCCGIKPGDEVITSSITFASTANVIIHCGAVPVFVDVDNDTLNINPEEIQKHITKKTKAIIAVHFLGQPCKMDEISKIAQQHKISVIEDAAHALETVYKGKKVGSISGFTAFSFYATKNITTGEGGMLTVQDEAMADKARIMSLHGISRDAWKRYSDSGYKHWDILYPGFKYNMFDLQAALGIHQLNKIESFWIKRKSFVEKYNQEFMDIPALEPVPQNLQNENDKNAYHLYVLRIRPKYLKSSRDEIMNMIQQSGIGLGVHFRAVHLMHYYASTYGYEKGLLPVAEDNSDRVFSIPLYPSLTDDNFGYIVDTVKKVIKSVTK